ncbi:NAD(P)/FAD-dependent oxidoreductase [Iodidimonas sp. SYSU 1G8]|uniref:flavin-containing monooxygenase n=1 Tax=Iodidimonas sp. SYSU 1G8 TaxID=3133967 RepID=UPI0031FE8247
MLRIAIIGAGVAGLCMAMRLKRAGIDSFTIYEKSAGVGGTWRDNIYPGCACDTPSHLYSFSFAPNPDWSRIWAEQPEILAYLERCAETHGLGPHTRFNTAVAAARFDSRNHRWSILLANGEEAEADILISGLGQLNVPAWPEIEGREDFGGTAFHSARWREDHDMTGLDVAVIGNGASATQFIPRIAPRVKSLTIFQRSANWVAPKPDAPYTRAQKTLFAASPWRRKLHRLAIFLRFELRFASFFKKSLLRPAFEKQLGVFMKHHVKDPALRAALSPDYPAGCKRVLLASDYYPALTLPNVRVVSDPIERIVADGLVTRGGAHHRVDTIIYGTGFRSTEFLTPVEITGTDGTTLNEAWREGAHAHRGVTVAGFPNFFMLYGPNTNLGHASIIFMIEAQVRYILRCLRRMRRKGLSFMDVKPWAMERYNRRLQRQLKGMVWDSGCGSWYKNAAGRITNNWPRFAFQYALAMRRPRWREYDLRR